MSAFKGAVRGETRGGAFVGSPRRLKFANVLSREV